MTSNPGLQFFITFDEFFSMFLGLELCTENSRPQEKHCFCKGRGRVCPQIGPNRKSTQNLDYSIWPDRSRRAEHFLSQNLISGTLHKKVLSSSLCEIVAHAVTILYRLDLNC